MGGGAGAGAYAAYRRAVRLALRLPSAGMRSSALSQMRAVAAGVDAGEVEKQLLSRVGALRAMLPRMLWPACEVAHTAAAAAASPADADVVSVDGKRNRNRNSGWVRKVPCTHADDITRHNKLMERMRFGGPVWAGRK